MNTQFGLYYFICNSSKNIVVVKVDLTQRVFTIISGTLLNILHVLNHLILTKSSELNNSTILGYRSGNPGTKRSCILYKIMCLMRDKVRCY